jgi:hypothetical protein
MIATLDLNQRPLRYEPRESGLTRPNQTENARRRLPIPFLAETLVDERPDRAAAH